MPVVAPIIAAVFPLIALYVVYKRNLYRTGSFGLVLVCFLWGGVALALSTIINPAVVHGGLTDHNTMMRLSAPVTEEIIKALLLIYLVRHPKFTYFVEGAIYGFAVGIGFAVVENFQYISYDSTTTFVILITRVLSTNLVQASASAIVGMALGIGRLQRAFHRRAILFFVGLLLAIALHAAFNNLVTRVTGSLLPVYAALVGVGSAALIVLVIKRGSAKERVWVEKTVDAAVHTTGGKPDAE